MFTARRLADLNYPYARTREALFRMAKFREPDRCHGFRLNYINPLTGGSAMPTLSTAMRLLPKGMVTEAYRSTAGTVFNVVEGAGVAQVGGERFAFVAKDVFVVPSWFPLTIEASADSVLFSFSDQIARKSSISSGNCAATNNGRIDGEVRDGRGGGLNRPSPPLPASPESPP